MLESYIEKKCCRMAATRGWLVRKLVFPGRSGAPDRMMLKSGVIVLVEFKRPGEGPRLLQQREINRLRKAGANVIVADSVAAFKNGMEAYGFA